MIELLDLLTFATATALMFVGLFTMIVFGLFVLGHWPR